MKVPFLNIYHNAHFETPHFQFKCVFDSHALSFSEKRDLDSVTHLASKRRDIGKGFLFDDIYKDYSLIFSIIEGTHVYCGEYDWGRRNAAKKSDEQLIMSHELEDFFQVAFDKLNLMEEKERIILRRAILLFYEAKHQMFYDDLGGILTINCLEFLLGSIFRIDKEIPDTEEIDFSASFSYVVGKFAYDKYIEEHILAEGEIKDYKAFKKARKIKNIKAYADQFREMRNWMAHGQLKKKPEFETSPSNELFTFLRRVEALVRVILIDWIYGKPYTRKFDALYQLILEQNVCTTFSPEFCDLKFRAINKEPLKYY